MSQELHRGSRIGAGGLLLSAVLVTGSALAQAPAQGPLVLPSALPPNIVLTLDDSQNMRRSYAPDTMFSVAPGSSVSPANTRRFKSSTFNPLYYNPTVTYVVPANASTTATTPTVALVNGYYNGGSSWRVNLSTSYRPTLSYDPANDASNANHVFADHAAPDLIAGRLGAVAANASVPAYYYVYDTVNPTSGAGTCDSTAGNDACYRLVRWTDMTTADQQNFANWYSYYRTRQLSMVSSLWRAVDASLLAGTGARLAWQGTDNACTSFNNGSTCGGRNQDASSASAKSNLLDEFTTSRRDALREWLRSLGASGGSATGGSLRTALQRSGRYYMNSGSSNNPYAAEPQVNNSPEYACRPNFNVLMTGSPSGDASNGSYCNGASCGNRDNDAQSLPQPFDTNSFYNGISYTPQLPYRDSGSSNAGLNANSLADVAFYYWQTDLRSNLNNNLLPYIADRSRGSASLQFFAPRNDPASWQHMVNFTVGIGLSSVLSNPPSGAPAWNANDPFTPLGTMTQWPDITTTTGGLFDLWHAAVNSRGQFFDGARPDDLANAMQATLQRAIDRTNAFSAIATNSSRLTTESVLYQASFSSVDWTGNVRAIDVNRDGSLGADLWNANAQLPAPGSRRVFTSGSSGNSAIAFTTAGLQGASLLDRFGATNDGQGGGATDSTADKVVRYLLGDQTNEQVFDAGNNAIGGIFRKRSSRIGDIVNSDIIYAGAEDFGYAVLPEAGDNVATTTTNESYAAFVAGKRCVDGGAVNCSTIPSKMIYVGANDGKLNGFNADNGQEVFAFVPRALINERVSAGDQRSQLALLADPSYNANHRYYVDGPPWIGDACLSAFNTANPTPPCLRWGTALVGVTGAGAKGVFALDVTVNRSGLRDWTDTLNTFSTASNPSRVLFDIDGATDNDLGFTIGQPVVGRLADGEFYAIFGNGYASTNGCAVLYLVRLRDGTVRKLPTTNTNSNTTCATPNGLGRPSLLDSSSIRGNTVGDRITDYVYAADLLGNVWRFDLTGLTPTSTWPSTNSVALKLFEAASQYSGNNCGGTATTQRITSGIEIGRGPVDRGSGQGNANLTYTAMLYFGTGSFYQDGDQLDTDRQTFYALMDDLSSPGAPFKRCNLQQRTIDPNTRNFSNTDNTTTIDYFVNNAKKGFFMDLPAGGTNGAPSERIVSMPLILPNRMIFASLIPNSNVCSGGGTSAIQAMDPLQGFSVRKQPASATIARIFLQNSSYDGVQTISGFIKNLIALDAGTKVYLYYGTSTAQVQKIDTTGLTETGSAGRGRTSWREVTGQQTP